MKNPAPSIKLWHAPDVMDALMLRGRFDDHRYPPHSHDTHCLAVITSGALEVETGGQRRLCRRGDVVVIDADTVHAGQPGPTGHWKMRVAHVLPQALARACEPLGLPRRDRFGTRSPFIRDAELSSQLYGVNWCSEVGEDRFKRSETLAGALIGLHARHAAKPGALPAVRSEPTLVRAVKARLRDDLGAKLTLPSLALEFAVTPFVLLRAFVREAGLSPHAYQQQERVRRASQLLRSGRAASEVALDTGFADQAHLSRVFKQHTGVTPRVFQAAYRQN